MLPYLYYFFMNKMYIKELLRIDYNVAEFKILQYTLSKICVYDMLTPRNR